MTLVVHCRDVGFEDVGISHRMIQAIEYYRKKANIKGEISSLSDIILWLAQRGFKIQICVDEKRSSDRKIQEFLENLDKPNLSNITIRVKKLHGLMHKKALITPVGIIQGSANLTFSGTGLNEEIINYAPFGTQAFKEMKLNIVDTFHGSKVWPLAD